MKSAYVITDITRIRKLNKQLGTTLRDAFRFIETREITYPSGHHTGNVYFKDKAGKNIRAWSPHEDEKKLVNYLLVGEPSVPDWLEISVQLNFPADTYNRRMAGVFIEDENGDILVAHRGKLTKGNAGLRRKDVLREFGSVIDVEDGSTMTKLIPISSLDDPELANHLFDFAFQARKIATQLGNALKTTISKETSSAKQGKAIPASDTTNKLDTEEIKDRILKLQNYYDEYSGNGHTKGHGGGKRTVEHGHIVKALEARLQGGESSQKAQAIDLAIISVEKIDLYEVKTSARTTDVYTGIGQLLIHGECISELFNVPVKRYLVLPDRPQKSHERHIVRKGGIQIVTFSKIDGKYIFIWNLIHQ